MTLPFPLALATLVAAAVPAAAGEVHATAPELDLGATGVQELALPFEAGQPFQVDVAIDGVLHTLDLAPYSLRSPHFTVQVQGADGRLTEWPAPPPQTYRGTVLGVPGSAVRVSLSGGELSGTLRDAAGETWGVQPAREFDATAPAGAHVVYHRSQVSVPEGLCAFEGDAAPAIDAPAPGWSGTGLRLSEVAFDADREFYQANGSSVGNTVNDIENVMNSVEAIYENDLQVTFDITVVIVRTAEPDPYTATDPSLLLAQVGSEWTFNQQGWQRDIVHMMTGKNINGSVIGIAVPGHCGGRALSQSKFSGSMTSRVALTAHEIGHNFGAGHCNNNPGGCFIMCSSLGGCGPVTLFAPVSIGSIAVSTLNSPCLVTLAPALAPPFTDSILTAAGDDTIWTTNDDVAIVDLSLNMPSAPWVYDFDAEGPAAHQQDELWSNAIQLGSGGPWLLSLYTRHVGVEFAEELVIERSNTAGDWVELARLTSDGVDQDHFELNVFNLPAGALFDGARVRLRGELSSTDDHWYVDEVAVSSAPPCELPFSYCTGKLSSEGCSPLILAMGAPSTIDPSPFTVEGYLTIALKPGLMFYGYGPAALPFQDGTLCVQPPTRRTATQLAGGMPGFVCDGTYQYDMNALIQSGLDPILVEGQTVNCQFWFRDVGVASQTGLTSGLQFEICD